MGLFIYSRHDAKLERATRYSAISEEESERLEDAGYELLRYLPWFSHAYAGLDIPEDEDSFDLLVFSHKGAGESTSVSYTGYSRFRDTLCGYLGYEYNEHTLEQPFGTMCWMSDCDGMFSNLAAQRIAREFREYENYFETIDPEIPVWFMPVYRAWRKVFCDAADNNGIVIHA